MNEAVEEPDGLEGEEVGQVLHANFEGVPVVQLQVGVNRETQVLLDLLAQLVQQVLRETGEGESVTSIRDVDVKEDF